MILILGVDISRCNAGLSLYTENFLKYYKDNAICVNINSGKGESKNIIKNQYGNKIIYNYWVENFRIINCNHLGIKNAINVILDEHPEIDKIIHPDFIFYPYLDMDKINARGIKVYMFIHLFYRGLLNRFTEIDEYIEDDFLVSLKSSWIEHKCITNSNNIICNSNFTKRLVLQYYPEYKGTIKEIPLGIEKKLFKPEPELTKNNAIYFGRLCSQKGIRYIIRDILQNLDFYKANPLTICSGLSSADIEKDIIRLAYLYGCVRYLGAINNNDLINILREYKYCIFPSLYEPYGLALNEALSMGKVCIVSNLDSGMIEQIDKDSAILFDFQKDSLAKFIESNTKTDWSLLTEKATAKANDINDHFKNLQAYMDSQ